MVDVIQLRGHFYVYWFQRHCQERINYIVAVILIFNFGLNHRTYINLLSAVYQGQTY